MGTAEVSHGWVAVADLESITTTPVEVTAGGRDWVAYRPAPGAPVAVVEARCPHRLVRLAHATVRDDGHLQCPYHGWQFAADGRCALVPSSGPQTAPPPRANLAVPAGIREDGGCLWLRVDPATEPDTRASEDLLTNLDPSLAYGWHPVARVEQVGTGPSGTAVQLLGVEYTLRRAGDLLVEPAVAGVQERFGLVWLAPRPPRVPLLDCPDATDPQFAQGWLEPVDSDAPAGVLAENFLDVAHFPFVHAATFGAAEEPYVEPFEVEADDSGLTSTQDQWYDNPADPGVAQGIRPVRQRRRATYTYRWPFQLMLRLEELDAGSVKTILFLLQPQGLRSTRVHSTMLFHGIGGVAVPGPQVVADEIAFETAVVEEDLQLQRAMSVEGLPLRLRDELHVRSDRSGVALRRVLTHHALTHHALTHPTEPPAEH